MKPLPLLALLLLAGPALADPPPPPAELKQLLQNEPINLDNWSRWSPRLRDWSGEHFTAAFPAFQDAFQFVKNQQRDPGGSRPDLKKPLEKDAVAWMLVAGAYLHDSKPRLGPVAVARAAADAAHRALRLDRGLARAHFYLSWAYKQEQLTPPDRGGPAHPDRNRLKDALRELGEARALDPRGVWYPHAQAGLLAVQAEKWDDAEMYLRLAIQENRADVNAARLLARAVNEQAFPFYQRREPFSAAVRPVAEQFPDDGVVAAHYARALLQDKKRDEARVQIEKARRLGTDPAKVIGPNRVHDIESGRARAAAGSSPDIVRGPLGVLKTLALWVLGFTLFYGVVMGGMCLGGLVLARWTRGPHAADMLGEAPGELVAEGQVARTRHESWLTRFYAVALLSALVLFYLSLPFVFVGLLLVFLLLLFLLAARRDEGGDVHGALLRASGGGMGAVFKAMFARVGTGGFGLRKTRKMCPRLYRTLEDVARRVDTDPVDEVWVAPGADFGVHQEGRGPFGVFGGRKRVLTVGLCVMNYLTVSEFQAILAHEYAHFSHADTFWNRFLFQVTLSLRTAMREMARTGGWVTWVNPFYWFFWLYSKSYSLLSAGFSRSREFLADRMACTLYGADVFVRALRKVCTDGVHFEMTVYDNIARLLKQKKAFVNMYVAFRQFRDESLTPEERRQLHRKLLGGEASVFASHPTFQERVEAARLLPRARRTNDTPSLELFEDPQAVEQELTDFLTEIVADALHV